MLVERDRLKFSIERFDHYYDSVNSKCAVFLALSTFIVGALITGYPLIIEKTTSSIWIHLFVFALVGLGLTVMIVVIIAATPFYSKGGNSLLYFGAIAELTLKDFQDGSAKLSADDELADLRNQVYQLSSGLQGKFKSLQLAGKLFTALFFLLIPLFILIAYHIK